MSPAIPSCRAAVTSTTAPGRGAAARSRSPCGEQTVCTFSPCLWYFPE